MESTIKSNGNFNMGITHPWQNISLDYPVILEKLILSEDYQSLDANQVHIKNVEADSKSEPIEML
jgi:hypothetical protein